MEGGFRRMGVGGLGWDCEDVSGGEGIDLDFTELFKNRAERIFEQFTEGCSLWFHNANSPNDDIVRAI
jgi:hypothetical protein